MCLEKVSNAAWCMHMFVHSIESLQCDIGLDPVFNRYQCCSCRTSVLCSDNLVCVMRRAAEFCTLWRQVISDLGRPLRRLLQKCSMISVQPWCGPFARLCSGESTSIVNCHQQGSYLSLGFLLYDVRHWSHIADEKQRFKHTTLRHSILKLLGFRSYIPNHNLLSMVL